MKAAIVLSRSSVITLTQSEGYIRGRGRRKYFPVGKKKKKKITVFIVFRVLSKPKREKPGSMSITEKLVLREEQLDR